MIGFPTNYRDIWEYLKNESRDILLYGTGDGADKIISKLRSDNSYSNIKGIFASPGFVRRRIFQGFEVMSFEDALLKTNNPIVLMCFGSSRPEVLSYIDYIRSNAEFYAPDVPVYGNNLFDNSFYQLHKDELNNVRELLSDELSIRTFDDSIRNKLTGDISYLRASESTLEEKLSLIECKGETFLDLGAYTGDTLSLFAEHCKSIRRIIAVEPDRRSYRKLSENAKNLPYEIKTLNCLISDSCYKANLFSNRGRGSHEEENPMGETIDAISVDSLDTPINLIKMDVEGNELAAIKGAKETIRTHSPTMQIACYHRSEDLFTIPLLVHKLNPSYKIYMRHLPHVPGWDTDFIFKL